MKNVILKRFLALITVASCLIGTFGQAVSAEEISTNTQFQTCIENVRSAYIARYPEKEQVIEYVINDITNQTQFADAYNTDGILAFRILEDAIMDSVNDVQLLNYDYITGRYYLSTSVPVVNQQEENYCGPASTIQALIGNGKLSNTLSNTNLTNLTRVANLLDTDSSGTNITNIRDYMRIYHTSSTTIYNTKAFTIYSYSKAISYVKNSIEDNGAVIMRVDDTSDFGYYNGVSLQHYVTITEVNYNTSTITVVDPNYMSAYRGTHTISFTEFNNAVKNNGWMVVLTSDQNENPYQYIY